MNSTTTSTRRRLEHMLRTERATSDAIVRGALAKNDADIRVARADARCRQAETEARALRQLAVVQEIRPEAGTDELRHR